MSLGIVSRLDALNVGLSISTMANRDSGVTAFQPARAADHTNTELVTVPALWL